MNYSMHYIISSPGRTGSTLLSKILRSAGIKNLVKTHNCLYIPKDTEQTTLLTSARRDLFRSIMSSLLAKRTKIYNYTNPNTQLLPIDPFVVECENDESEFQQQYRWHKWYPLSYNFSKSYYHTETFYLEDFANDYDYVLKKLGLTQLYTVIPTVEIGYRYTDLVINYKECKKIFDVLELTSTFIPITKPYDPTLPN